MGFPRYDLLCGGIERTQYVETLPAPRRPDPDSGQQAPQYHRQESSQDKVRRVYEEHGMLALLRLKQARLDVFYYTHFLDLRFHLGRHGAGLQAFHPALLSQEKPHLRSDAPWQPELASGQPPTHRTRTNPPWIDNRFGFGHLFIRGMDKMVLCVGLAFAVMLTIRLGHIPQGRTESGRFQLNLFPKPKRGS